MKLRTDNGGFTLIEVLAALIIVSLGMLAVIQAVSQTINNSSYLREKTVAHWVAMNKLAEVRLSNNPPPGGDSDGDVDMAGVTWRWRMTISATDAATMQRIDIKVAPKTAGEDVSLASVSGFYGSAILIGGHRNEWDPSQQRRASSSASSSSSSSSSDLDAGDGR